MVSKIKTKTKMKNDFAYSGNAESALENQGPAFEYGFEDNGFPETREVLQPPALPAYLENWYRNNPDNPAANSMLSSHLASKSGAGFNFLKNKKTKSVLKSSLQALTIAILVIAASGLGGFIILDRKINLEGTEASLNRMSETLAEASAPLPPPLTPPRAGGESLGQEGNPRVLNASANNNVETGSLPAAIDSDQDGVSDEVEEKLATNPFSADTDGDGYSDGVEVKNGYDPLTPAVENAASVAGAATVTGAQEACSAGGQSASGCGVTQNTQNTAAVPAVSGASLTSQDYAGLAQMGLSQEDINQAASGGLSNNEKVNLQGKVLGSDLMQGSIADVVNMIPAAELPKVADSELNLYKSDREEDINRYFQDLNKTLEENFASLKSLNSETIKNNILQGNYQDAAMTRQALEKASAALAKLPTPDAVRAQSKSLLSFFRIYADLLNEQSLAAADEASFTRMIANMKALETLAPEFQKALQGAE